MDPRPTVLLCSSEGVHAASARAAPCCVVQWWRQQDPPCVVACVSEEYVILFANNLFHTIFFSSQAGINTTKMNQ